MRRSIPGFLLLLLCALPLPAAASFALPPAARVTVAPFTPPEEDEEEPRALRRFSERSGKELAKRLAAALEAIGVASKADKAPEFATENTAPALEVSALSAEVPEAPAPPEVAAPVAASTSPEPGSPHSAPPASEAAPSSQETPPAPSLAPPLENAAADAPEPAAAPSREALDPHLVLAGENADPNAWQPVPGLAVGEGGPEIVEQLPTSYVLQGKILSLTADSGRPIRAGSGMRRALAAAAEICFTLHETESGRLVHEERIKVSRKRLAAQDQENTALRLSLLDETLNGAVAALVDHLTGQSSQDDGSGSATEAAFDDRAMYQDSPGKRLKPVAPSASSS